MNEIPVTNHGTTSLSVGSAVVLPGETKHFPAHLVPIHLRADAQPEAPPADEPDTERLALDEILEHNVTQITEMLPALSLGELDDLEIAETEGKARKGLLSAIVEERLRRASTDDQDAPGDPEMDAYAAGLTEMDDDELAEQLELMEGQPTMIAAIEAELERRAQD